jgi:hypothetical protein
MLRYAVAFGVALAVLVSNAPAQEPVPIRLLLTPAKPPTPALRYQLLPDARLTISGDAAPIYKQVIELLEKKHYRDTIEQVDAWKEQPLNRLPKEEIRKLLDNYQDVFALLDKAARQERCEWGFRERVKKKGFSTTLPEVDAMRDCARLLALRARLAIAEERFDAAILALRTGVALGRQVGETETLISYLVGVAIAAEMLKQLDTLIAQPAAPNLYYALTDLPVPLVSIRKAMQGERLGVYATFPELAAAATDLQAGNIDAEKLEASLKILSDFSDRQGTKVDRTVLAFMIRGRHETAKKALIAEGRPREKVEAMPHLQVALLHALLEYDGIYDELLLCHDLPYPKFSECVRPIEKRLRPDRPSDAKAAAIPFASLVIPATARATFAGARADRKIALLRCLEALRYYAATHDGKLPPALADVKEVPIPLDPVTGKSFAYQLDGDTATLRAPPPAKETSNSGNTVVYELQIRK